LAIKKRKTKQKSAKRLPLKAISQRGEQGSVPTATHFVHQATKRQIRGIGGGRQGAVRMATFQSHSASGVRLL
jgi:hypothetical protein